MSKQHPLKVTNMDVPSRASASVSEERFSPFTRVRVSPSLTIVTTVTVESLSRPSVSMSRKEASFLKRSYNLQCSPVFSMLPSPRQSPSSRSS